MIGDMKFTMIVSDLKFTRMIVGDLNITKKFTKKKRNMIVSDLYNGMIGDLKFTMIVSDLKFTKNDSK